MVSPVHTLDDANVSRSNFWHQSVSSTFTGPAKYFVFRLLRLEGKPLVARYIYATVVFILSGAMHVCGEVTAGVPIWEGGAVQFFAMQALGLAVEDSIVAIWQRVGPKKTGGKGHQMQWWQRVVGYVWVVAWMAWSMPVWTYPASRRSQGEGMLPFSIVDYVKA